MNPNKVIELHRYPLMKASFLRKILLIFHSIFLIFFTRFIFEFKFFDGEKGKKYAFIKSMHRRDYDEFFNLVFAECKQNKTLINIKRKFRINFFALRNFKENASTYKAILASSEVDRIYLFLSFLHYASTLKYFKSLTCDVFCAFADMQPVENYLVQIYKDMGVKTLTLQHGLFVDYSNVINISAVSYECVVSNYFLSWGKFNKNLIDKYNPDCKVVVCGNPSIKLPNKKLGTKSFFTIMLDWDVFKVYNQELLDIGKDIACRTNMKFLIRFHPSNNKTIYEYSSRFLIDDNRVDIFDSFFVLGHTSSMIHVCDRLGLKVFKYYSKVPSSPFDKNRVFRDANQLLKLINLFDNEVLPFKETINIGPIGEKSSKSYRDFFKSL